jgi:formiminoglutamase
MPWTTPAPTSVFPQRTPDPLDPRLGEAVTGISLKDLTALKDAFINNSASAWALLGYADDEGIAMNGGRVGAKEGPDAIRKAFYKMTPSLLNPVRKDLVDLGNLSAEVPLAERHQRGRHIVHQTLSLGHRTLSLGGGHDYAYADGAGFLDHCASLPERPVMLNFDAHLDVRTTEKGFNSGTPFRRLLTDYPGNFEFIEVGLRNHCNSFDHLQWAQNQGAKILLMDDIRSVGLLALLQPLLESLKGRPAFVSVDIDAFTSSEAPGCSQSWAGGLTFDELSPVLREVQQSLNVLGLGIYEVSPPLDVDHQTSKLAAMILHQTLFTA